MDKQNLDVVAYKKSRFFTRLPKTYFYTPSHFWLANEGDDHWRIGYTKFALRMLGDIVEYEFQTVPNNLIQVGEVIGWIEGFKAVSDLFSVIDGKFKEGNTSLEDDPSIIYSDPYNRGWLYKAEGKTDSQYFDVHGYIDFLDKLIDKMLVEEGKYT